MEAIPKFNLDELTNGKGLDELLLALKNVGFIYLSGHKIPQTLIDSFFDQSQAFFDSKEEDKLKYGYLTDTNHGYLRLGAERLNVQVANLECKEAFNFRKDMLSNPKPAQFESDTVTNFAKECHRTCMELLRVYATCLQISQGSEYFVERHRFDLKSGDVLRCLHYPGTVESNQSTVRAGGHSDFGSMTLLFLKSDDPGGLEIVSPSDNSRFIPVPNIDGHIIVNTGDLMEYWTSSYLRSTVHRVIVPPRHQHPR